MGGKKVKRRTEKSEKEGRRKRKIERKIHDNTEGGGIGGREWIKEC